MNKRQYFYRNAQARDHLELFLVSAVSSLLLLRFYLAVTGYPQVGGGDFHIAHMLYGGLLLMAAVVINLSFLGMRSERVAALVGGVGFGLFIDELGKFITKDNDYFFQPTIGIIYALFCVLYLTFNFISRKQRLTSEEYQLNALRQFEEAVVHDMDTREKAVMRNLLAQADRDSPITQGLRSLLTEAETVEMADSLPERFRKRVAQRYARFWKRRESSHLVGILFGIQAAAFLLAVSSAIYHNFNSAEDVLTIDNSYTRMLIIAQLFTSMVTAGFVAYGAVRLVANRIEALEWFRRAVLTNLFLTEFFLFSRVQFKAMPGFIVSLLLLLLVRFALSQERRRSS